MRTATVAIFWVIFGVLVAAVSGAVALRSLPLIIAASCLTVAHGALTGLVTWRSRRSPS